MATSKAKLAEHLFERANALYDTRVALRKDYELLEYVLKDAGGTRFEGLYGDADVKAARDAVHELDNEIGQVARWLERVARKVKKG